MKFKIGETVVCVKSHPSNLVVKGNKYVVAEYYQCPCCRKPCVKLEGVKPITNRTRCGSCSSENNNIIIAYGVNVLDESRFERIDPLMDELTRIENELMVETL